MPLHRDSEGNIVDDQGNFYSSNGGAMQTPEQLAAMRQQQAASTGPNPIAMGIASKFQTPEQYQQAMAAKQAQEAAAKAEAYNSHWQYGGATGLAGKASDYFGGLAQDAQNRQGVGVDYAGANNAFNQGQLSRDRQNDVAYGMLQRAQGNVPSIAQMQADRQMGLAAAEQSSAAASARGPAGLALAQQGAAANTAAMQSNISNQAQINGANERMQAEQAAFGAYSGMRSGDAALQGQMAQQAQYQGGLDAQQRALNDQRSQQMYGNQIGINTTQLQAQGNQMSMQAGQAQAQAQLSQNAKFHSDDQTAKYVGMGLGAVGTAAGIGAMILGGGGGSAASGKPDPGAGGYEGNAVPDGSLNTGTSGGSYGQGTYGPDDPNTSDVLAKRNITGLAGPAPKRMSDAEAAKLQAMGLGLMSSSQAEHNALLGRGASVGDPVTAQFGSGLAPSSYEYKSGLGTPGMKVGPMAQNMAANPITATAVRRDPNTGLLAIDGADGLKVALGGVGHLASKHEGLAAQLSAQERQIAQLKAQAAMMQQGNAAQYGGLMGNGPSVGASAPTSAAASTGYGGLMGPDPALQARADEMRRAQEAQASGLLGNGPSIGDAYLRSVRGY